MTTETNQSSHLQRRWALRLFVLQILAALVAWIAVSIGLKSILVTGPVLALLGLALAVTVRSRLNLIPLLFALSAPAVAALGAFVIAIFRLGPEAAYAPILVILSSYVLLIVAFAPIVLQQLRNWPPSVLAVAPRQLRFSLKFLLGVMTAVAVLTAIVTAAVRLLVDFPIVFGAFGSATMVLVFLVAWRFYAYRQRVLYPLQRAQPLTLTDWWKTKLFAAISGMPEARCSFCGGRQADAGPFAEGCGGTLICRHCADRSTKLIVNASKPSARDEAEPAAKAQML